jgi:hypothetical protein
MTIGNHITGGRLGSLQRILDIVATVAIIAVCGLFAWSLLAHRLVAQPASAGRAAQLTIPVEPVSLSEGTIAGVTSARVGMVVYSDFECPYCGVFARDTFPKIQSDYLEAVADRHPLPAGQSLRW